MLGSLFRLLSLLLICTSTRGLPVELTLPITPIKPLELGLSLQLMLPDAVTGLEIPIPLLGPQLAFPLWNNHLEIHAFYGSNDEATGMLMAECDYRYNIVTPFITGHALLGLHYLRFKSYEKSRSYFGPLTGMGFTFPMAQNFNMGLGMKIYLSQKTVLSFGGGFNFLL